MQRRVTEAGKVREAVSVSLSWVDLWNDGALKGMVEFEGVCNFDRGKNGLVPVKVDTWENFVFGI